MKNILLSFLLAIPVFSQEKTSEKVSDTQNQIAMKKLIVAAWKVSSRISPDPKKLNYVFDKSFFNYISRDKLTQLFKEMYEKNGSVVSISSVSYNGAFTANFFFYTDKDYVIPTNITVEDNKWKVTGLFFQPSFKKTETIDDVASSFEKMPYSSKAVLLKRLSGLEDNIYAKNETKPLAIGSTFKLYVLAWLVENDVNWNKVIKLSSKQKSLPSGRIQNMPENTPFTIFSLAQAMISESDNTAADMLIGFIGRENIEKSLPFFFNSYQKLNTPFLKTSEIFKLKADEDLLAKYALSDVKNRRKILKELVKRPIPPVEKFLADKPKAVTSVEWFASMEDVCRLFDYFRKKNNPYANAILSLNNGLNLQSQAFKYVGYKGGSEKGVLSMNWLIQAKSGTWYCFASAANDEKEDINQNEYFQIVQKTIYQIEKEVF